MAAVRSVKVPARHKDVYEALRADWDAACIARTADRATSVNNFSYVPGSETWLVHWGPCPMVVDGKAWRFPDDAREWTSAELRAHFGILTAAERRAATRRPAATKRQSGPTAAEVLDAARRLAELVSDVPADIAAVLFPAGRPPTATVTPITPTDELDDLDEWLATGTAVA